MNLFMHAPLYDHFGKLRYFMGAQIDVSHIIEHNPELESLQRVVAQLEGIDGASKTVSDTDSQKDPFQQLVETLDMEELRAVRTWEDRILQEYSKDDQAEHKPRRPEIVRNHYSALLKNGLPTITPTGSSFGMYNNVRCSLRAHNEIKLTLLVLAGTTLPLPTYPVHFSVPKLAGHGSNSHHGQAGWKLPCSVRAHTSSRRRERSHSKGTVETER